MPIDVRRLAQHGTALASAATALVTAAAVLTVVAPDADAARPQGGKAAEKRQIASSVLGEDFKFTLTALRSTTDPLRASVRLKVFVLRDGVWSLSDQVPVGNPDSWFWFPLTGRGAICEFSTASTNPAPIVVSLLITPSVGCSPTENFELRDGKFSVEQSRAQKPRGAVDTGDGGMAGVVATRLSPAR
ncbi:hypothetical protein [Streptomyces vastus]|uniref:Secreted protein n=1 Tax=Streptomyces vastus TaxID=285451 RepID=A0ABP6DDN1_9ACTN